MLGGMNIDVRLIDGRTRTLDVSPNDMIDTIRSRIAVIHEVDPKYIRLRSFYKNLDDGYTINDYGIKEDSVIDAALSYVDCSKKHLWYDMLSLSKQALPASQGAVPLLHHDQKRESVLRLQPRF